MLLVRTLYFLAAFIAMGESLDCPVCNATSMNNCVGSNQTCPPGYDQCGLILVKKTWRRKEQIIVKTCTQVRDCNDSIAILNMGNGRSILSICSKCAGENCKGTPLTLLPNSSKYNGRTCKACYAGDKECNVKDIECHGNEHHCAELSGSTGGNPRHSTMRGCANHEFCEIRKILTPALGFTTLHSDDCWIATENHASVQTVPDLVGIFLLSFPGFIFPQILP